MDLLLERDEPFHPIEVKAASSPTGKDTSGLADLRKTYPGLRIAKGLVVAPCEKLLALAENDYAMPWDAVLPPASGG